jgi:hypothetical protein
MPSLSYALLADYVRAESGVAHVIAAGIDTVYAAEVPTGHNLGLLIAVRFTRAECGRPHRLEIRFSDEDGNDLAQASTVVTPDWDDTIPLHWGRGLLTALNLGVPLTRYGLYQFVIMVDDNQLGELPLRVVPRAVAPQDEPEPVAPPDEPADEQ